MKARHSAVGRLPSTGGETNVENAPSADAAFASDAGRLPSTGALGVWTISKSKSPDTVWAIACELNSTRAASQKLNNPGFKPLEFDSFENQAGSNPGLNPVEFDGIKAHQLFGEQLPKLLDELNQVLAA